MYVNVFEALGFFSNILFVFTGISFLRKRLFLPGILNIFVFLFSFLYHNCFDYTHLSATYPDLFVLSNICIQTHSYLITITFIDYLFANTTAICVFVMLLPIRKSDQLAKGLTLFGSIIIIWAGALSNVFSSVEVPPEMIAVNIAVLAYVLVLFIIFWGRFYYQSRSFWSEIKQYYSVKFSIWILFASIGVGCIGLFIWICIQRLFPAIYLEIHPTWHMCSSISGLLFSIAINV
jgi:hypothetical protein